MKLKKNENTVSSCYMANLGHPETAKVLNINRTPYGVADKKS